MKAPSYYIFGLCICALLFAPDNAFAQISEDNILDGVIRQYRNTAATWSATLVGLATNLFIILATLELSYSGIRLALEGAELQTWMGEFIQRIMFLGLFLFLLVNGGFASEIVQSFREAAGSASNFNVISPSTVLELGLEISDQVMAGVSFWSNATDSLGLIISALIIVIAFALMAAVLILALVEMYILINAGVFLLGFGGSRFTQDFAIKFMTYVVSVGAKLFILQLVIGLGVTIMENFLKNFSAAQNSQVLVMIGVAITFLALSKTVPDMVQSIINGVAVGSSGTLLGAAAQTYSAGATAANAAGSATANTYAAGSALREAAKYASAQGQGSVVGTAKALSDAVGNAAANKVRGTPGAQFGSTMGGAYEQMRKQRAELQASNSNKPRPGEAQYISPAIDLTAKKRNK